MERLTIKKIRGAYYFRITWIYMHDIQKMYKSVHAMVLNIAHTYIYIDFVNLNSLVRKRVSMHVHLNIPVLLFGLRYTYLQNINKMQYVIIYKYIHKTHAKTQTHM